MTERKVDERKGDRRKSEDPAYRGEERRQGDRREQAPNTPKPS